MEKAKRYSKKREAILACIRSTKSHPDAEWVYEKLKDEFPDLSLGTVYRNIARFKEEGEIISLGTVNGVERFDGNVKPHGHMVCRICARVIDMPDDVEITVPPVAGFNAERCEVFIHGVCADCAHNTESV